MNDFQFYPTPLSLAKKAWAKFKDRDFKRVLEPSAGTGALIKGMPHFDSKYGSTVPVDCIEIDITKHAQLRELPGVQVVGFDFMKFGGGLIHSHAILNPPFRSGVQHVLRVWDNMFDGEIVAHLHEAQPGDLRNGKRNGGDGHIRPGGQMLVDDLPVIHPVELVA